MTGSKKLKIKWKNGLWWLDQKRRELFWRLHIFSGRSRGEKMAGWVLFLWIIARPVTIVELLAARVLDIPAHCIRINGISISLEFFTRLDISPLPGPWFRIIRREDGVLTVEQKAQEV